MRTRLTGAADAAGPVPYGAAVSLIRCSSNLFSRLPVESPDALLCRRGLAPRVGDRQPPVAAEVACRDLRAGRELTSLVLRPVHQPKHLLHDLPVEPARDEVRRAVVL